MKKSYLCSRGYDKEYNKLLPVCDNCPNILSCIDEIKSNGREYRQFKMRNCKINVFGEDKIEIVIYKKDFYWLEDSANLKNDIEKNFVIYDCPSRGRVLIPREESIRINDLYESLEACSKRAQDNYFGYAYANEWKYFFTFTFDRKKVNRYDDDEVMYHWQLFRKKLQYYDKDVKILTVKERHEDGALHFHGLIQTEKDFNLKPHYDKNGVWKLSKSGAPLFEFNFWDYGLHTIAVLPKDGNYAAAINYLITYTTKQSNVGYRQKRYFKTQNLNFKESFVTNEDDAMDIIANAHFDVYKDNENMTVYRTFNVKNG